MVGALRSPTAMRLIAAAAFRYASSSVGESACSSAMLSKFALIVSSGSQLPASTSSPSRSPMARAYSARLRRWNVPAARVRLRRRGGVHRRLERARSAPRSVAGSGRREPGGGIMPACSLRIIFSASSACCAALAMSNAASDGPLVMRGLWQPAQVPLDERVVIRRRRGGDGRLRSGALRGRRRDRRRPGGFGRGRRRRGGPLRNDGSRRQPHEDPGAQESCSGTHHLRVLRPESISAELYT